MFSPSLELFAVTRRHLPGFLSLQNKSLQLTSPEPVARARRDAFANVSAGFDGTDRRRWSARRRGSQNLFVVETPWMWCSDPAMTRGSAPRTRPATFDTRHVPILVGLDEFFKAILPEILGN